jgi:hypothetical protein
MLIHEGADPRITVILYKAVVMNVLIFGLETRVVTPSMLKALESFH